MLRAVSLDACEGESKLAANNDWPRLADLADAHGLSVRLGGLLQRYQDQVPAELLEALARETAANARRNLEFTQRLLRIVNALAEVGVPALAYKGPVLAEMLYGSQPLREFRDVDVLIRPEDWPSAKQRMIALGLTPNQSFTVGQEAAYVRSNNEMAFDGWGARNWLEIEWAIVPRYFSVEMRVEDLLARSVEFSLAGAMVRTLCAEDTLLALAVHGSKHGWSRLCWVADIADLLRVRELDWDVVLREAERLGVMRMVRVALRLAAQVNPGMRADLPLNTIAEQQAVDGLAGEFWRALQYEPQRYTQESWRYFLMMPRLRERGGDRLRFVWRLLATPETGEWKLVSLPDSLYGLYYPLRGLRLAMKLLRRLLRF